MPTFNEIKTLRKSGNLSVAFQQAQEWVQMEPENTWAKRALAWVLYDLTKEEVNNNNWGQFEANIQELQNLGLPDDEQMVFENFAYPIGKMVFRSTRQDTQDTVRLKSLFDGVISFPFPKPSKGYSFLLKAFHKAFKETKYYLEFTDRWDLKHLEIEDFKEEKLENGRTIMSIGEQVLIANAKALLSGEVDDNNPFGDRIINENKIEQYLPILENAIENYPNLKYPAYYQGKLLMAIGYNKDALEAYLPFARKNRHQFLVWEILGDFYSADTKKAIAAYATALSCKSPKEFLVKVKEKLAELLIQQEYLNHAKTEIEELVATRQSHQWRLTSKVNNWQKSSWYNNTNGCLNNYEFYRDQKNEAIKLLYPNLEFQIATVYFVNNERGIANWIVDTNTNGFFKFCPFFRRLRIGDNLKLGFDSTQKSTDVITAEKSNESGTCIKNFSGELRLHGSGNFGFVNDVFVPKDLLRKEGSISGKAILAYNKRKENWGWKAYKIS
ncbi:MAG: hypothetical protein P1U70_24040 [Saprospiraceae bacterium]|jgi:hypothetical protein|nr:hypothetical protein [Saprospiraceae bacterium]